MRAAGYTLSQQAAAVALRQDMSRKSVDYPVAAIPPGGQDGDNLRRGTVTTEARDDRGDACIGLSATWACVSFWAGNIASLPVTVQRPAVGGVAVDDPSHPLYRLVHDSPNADQSAFDFWEFMVASVELRGNAYAEIVRGAGRAIVSLDPIRPDLVQVGRRSGDGALEYRWVDRNGRHVVGQEDMLHIRGFGGGPLGGVSPLSACRASFEAAVATEYAAGGLFRNGARPGGVLSTDTKLDREQRIVLEELLQERFVGAMNAGRPMLLDGGLKWEALTIDPSDAEMLESRRFGVEDVCRIFEVDPHLVGQMQGNTTLGSSITEQTLSVLKFKMRKRLKRFEGAISKQLITPADRAAGIAVRFNVEAFLRADSVGRATFYQSALTNGWMTINEVRALEGLPPVTGGDVPRMQKQNVPITAAPEIVP